MYVISGDNPTQMYWESMNYVLNNGDIVKPRGQEVREVRPACLEYTNPLNRFTFLGGRRINPFFQLAESLWILSGRADVKWLTMFNRNMASFSDDGVWFNAPYGERIRSFGKNAAHNQLVNPIDQLVDAYRKLLTDKDTRQATIVIDDPHFDNSTYTIDQHGRDIACNLIITLKIRDNRLHMSVFNRSNDLHWGTFGANLCQFSTIQEELASWLRNSGKEGYQDIRVGTYNQITDSLHIYTKAYGSSISDEVRKFCKGNSWYTPNRVYWYNTEPRMCQSCGQFDEFIRFFWAEVSPYLESDEYMSEEPNVQSLLNKIDDQSDLLVDDYWKVAINGMIAYRQVKLGNLFGGLYTVAQIRNSQTKLSMLYFLRRFIDNYAKDGNHSMVVTLNEEYNHIGINLANSLSDRCDMGASNQVLRYLGIEVR